jgi:hypothetical protein
VSAVRFVKANRHNDTQLDDIFLLKHLHVSAASDSVLVVVDHMTLMAHFFPCAKEITVEEMAKTNYNKCTVCMAFRVCWLVTLTRDLSAHSSSHFGDA